MAKELQKFFCRYPREEKDGWESTPKVRWCVYQFGNKPDLHDFPAFRTRYRNLYHDGGKLHEKMSDRNSQAQYDSGLFASTSGFTFEFAEPTRLLGLPKAVLYMSCPDKDVMNVFVILRKKDKNGMFSMHLKSPISAMLVESIEDIPEKERGSHNLRLGYINALKASHRHIDSSRSIHENFPFHTHTREREVPLGGIARLEIGIWNVSIDFDPGESLTLQGGGRLPSIAEYTDWSTPRLQSELNNSSYRFHCGPSYPSSLMPPIVPGSTDGAFPESTDGKTNSAH